MLSKEEIKLLNEILGDLELDGDKEKLKRKLSLVVKQIELMEKSQEEVSKIQDEIVALDEKVEE